jgi:hypothetical protein
MSKGLLIPFFHEIQSHHIWLRIAVLSTSLVRVPILLYHAIEKPMIMILLGVRLVTRLGEKEPKAMAVAA